MNSLFKCLLLFGTLLPQWVNAQDLSKARAYSFAIRDRGLSVDEVQGLSQGQLNVKELLPQWLRSEDHRTRMLRFFDEILGFTEDLNLIRNDFRLDKTSEGIYYSKANGSCTKTESVASPAWWLPTGQTIEVCPSIMRSDITIVKDDKTRYCANPGPNGFADPNCGCGPELLFCLAQDEAIKLRKEAQLEFASRGLAVYESGGTWMDLLAGQNFFGTRKLYWIYLNQQYASNVKLWSNETLSELKAVPIDQKLSLAFPKGPQRAGVATMPAFLIEYNNFRSRITGLTRSFLCKDIGPDLNTDGIEQFISRDLSPADLEHGTKPGCASCHYALDNLGSTLLSWNDRGFARPNIKDEGHVFGETGAGALFLMQGFIERGPGFSDCMAKRAWESFSGRSYQDLKPEEKLELAKYVSKGPKELIENLLMSKEFEAAL